MFKVLTELRSNTKEFGLITAMKTMFKKYGWKVGVAIFMYYLIRDVTLYIILPYVLIPYLNIFWFIFIFALIAEITNNKRVDQLCLLFFIILILYPFFEPIIAEYILLKYPHH